MSTIVWWLVSFSWLKSYAFRESWQVWIRLSSWRSDLFTCGWSTLASFIIEIAFSYFGGNVSEEACMQQFHTMYNTCFWIWLTSTLQCAGLFPTFDLIFLYSRLHPKKGLYRIMVGYFWPSLFLLHWHFHLLKHQYMTSFHVQLKLLATLFWSLQAQIL